MKSGEGSAYVELNADEHVVGGVYYAGDPARGVQDVHAPQSEPGGTRTLARGPGERRTGLGQARKVGTYHVRGLTLLTIWPDDQLHSFVAQSPDGLHVVTDKENGAAVPGYVFHLAQALALEAHIAHGQHFVHYQDLRVQVGSHREGQAYVHAAGVALDRGVQEAADLAELHDLVELTLDLGPGHAQDGSVQQDVLAP